MLGNLLKIKSIVTILLVLTLVAIVVFSVLSKREIPGELMGAFVGGIGLALGSLFAKKDNNIE